MNYDCDRRGRHSIRLRGYDYARAGMYFVTVCTRDRECLFGDVVDGTMRLNDAGQIVDEEWRLAENLRDEIQLDAWVIMPNHVHGIVIIDNVHAPVGAYGHTPLRLEQAPQSPDTPFRSPSKTIGAMIRGFKASVTKRINELRCTPARPLWQRNYYDHIIRDEKSLHRVRQYIVDNPAQWALDRENPARAVRATEGSA